MRIIFSKLKIHLKYFLVVTAGPVFFKKIKILQDKNNKKIELNFFSHNKIRDLDIKSE